MKQQLTEPQLAQVVAEVTRLAQLREEEQQQGLDREQVAQIFQRLNLPIDLLDDALVRVERQEVLAREQAERQKAQARQRQRRAWIIGSVVAVVLAMTIIVGVLVQRRNTAVARIQADEGRITRASDDGGDLQTITRNGEEVYYRVLLRDVPRGENLSLACNWIDPNNQVVRQNRWKTQATDKAVWATSCRCQLGASATPGTWKVEMLLDDRVVSRATFQVE